MTLKQARTLKVGDTIHQKMHHYEMTIKSIEEFRPYTGCILVMVDCMLPNGSLMKHNHKELYLGNN